MLCVGIKKRLSKINLSSKASKTPNISAKAPTPSKENFRCHTITIVILPRMRLRYKPSTLRNIVFRWNILYVSIAKTHDFDSRLILLFQQYLLCTKCSMYNTRLLKERKRIQNLKWKSSNQFQWQTIETVALK